LCLQVVQYDEFAEKDIAVNSVKRGEYDNSISEYDNDHSDDHSCSRCRTNINVNSVKRGEYDNSISEYDNDHSDDHSCSRCRTNINVDLHYHGKNHPSSCQ
jgi:hypothetical protein